jgi:chemotaxis protein MotB
MRRRKRKQQEPEDDERWMITYADMLTVLLIFFIVMYSMSEIEKAKYNSLVESLKGAFEVSSVESAPETVPEISSEEIGLNPPEFKVELPDIPEKNEEKEENEQKLDELMVKLNKYVEEHKLSTEVDLVNLPRGVQITIKDSVLFDEGEAVLKKQAVPVLNAFGGLFKDVPNAFSIEGHTDNQPIVNSTKFESNWELSAARADSVREFLQKELKIKPSRMSIIGYSEYQPRKPNDSAANRAENRRVNIVVLR